MRTGALDVNENCLKKVHRILTEPNVLLFPRPKKRPISPFKRGQITSKSNSSDNSIGPWRHVSSSHKPFCFNVYNQKQHLFWKEKGGRKKVVNLFRIFLDPCLNKKKSWMGWTKYYYRLHYLIHMMNRI